MDIPYESARARISSIVGSVLSGPHEFLVTDWQNAEFWAELAEDPVELAEFVRDMFGALIASANDLAVMVDDLYARAVPDN